MCLILPSHQLMDIRILSGFQLRWVMLQRTFASRFLGGICFRVSYQWNCWLVQKFILNVFTNCQAFPQPPRHFSFLAAGLVGLILSSALPSLVTLCFSIPTVLVSVSEAVSHWGGNMQVSNDQGYCTSSACSRCFMVCTVSLEKCLFKSLASLLNWLSSH